MNKSYYKTFSKYLNRDMEFNVYGYNGKAFLVFPSQDGRFYDFENNGMVESIKSYIEDGNIQLFCVDSVDTISWSSNDDGRVRSEIVEAYHNYICEEFILELKKINRNEIYTTGCSMGATHALTFLLRRPDLFKGCIALSGVYRASFFFNDYFDDLVYNNSPIDFIEGMSLDHPYVSKYREKDIILCVGQGAYEDVMLEDTKKMMELFEYKNIDCWIDIWGYDVNHDWPWWRKQLPYFIKYII